MVCVQVVADSLPVEQINGIKKMFDMMDKDKNGNLTFEELRDGLSRIGHTLPDHDVQMLLEAVSNSHMILVASLIFFCYFFESEGVFVYDKRQI